jgi:cytochrome c oxidase subunit 3
MDYLKLYDLFLKKEIKNCEEILISEIYYKIWFWRRYVVYKGTYQNFLTIWIEKIIKKYDFIYNNIKHYFHLVTLSPWPIFSSLILFSLMSSSLLYFHYFKMGGIGISFSIILLFSLMFVWWRDVIREATFEGFHTKKVQFGLRIGMLLFILSETMSFFSFFWAFFDASLSPVIEIGSIWPPLEIQTFNYMKVPLLNTLILLVSGAAVTWAHYCIIAYDSDVLNYFTFIDSYKYFKEILKEYLEYNFYLWDYCTIGYKYESIIALSITIFLAILFTLCQIYEYFEAFSSFSDGIYGTTFYIATGFHGLHVIIGTIFLTVCSYRRINDHLTTYHHFGFEAAAWYWHFVDVIWLFLFISIYIWGSIL